MSIYMSEIEIERQEGKTDLIHKMVFNLVKNKPGISSQEVVNLMSVLLGDDPVMIELIKEAYAKVILGEWDEDCAEDW